MFPKIVWLDPLYAANLLLRRAVSATAPFAHGQLLDIGCGAKPYESLFHVDRYIGMDTPADNAAIDVEGDGMHLPFASEVFDTVLCTEVLEHIPEPALLINEAYRVLGAGGHLILTTPQTWGVHMAPRDYYRYTEYGLRYLAQISGFEVISVTATSGLWTTVGQRVADVIFNGYAGGMPWGFKRFLLPVCATPPLVGLALDRLLGKRGDTLDNVLIARKNATD